MGSTSTPAGSRRLLSILSIPAAQVGKAEMFCDATNRSHVLLASLLLEEDPRVIPSCGHAIYHAMHRIAVYGYLACSHDCIAIWLDGYVAI